MYGRQSCNEEFLEARLKLVPHRSRFAKSLESSILGRLLLSLFCCCCETRSKVWERRRVFLLGVHVDPNHRLWIRYKAAVDQYNRKNPTTQIIIGDGSMYVGSSGSNPSQPTIIKTVPAGQGNVHPPKATIVAQATLSDIPVVSKSANPSVTIVPQSSQPKTVIHTVAAGKGIGNVVPVASNAIPVGTITTHTPTVIQTTAAGQGAGSLVSSGIPKAVPVSAFTPAPQTIAPPVVPSHQTVMRPTAPTAPSVQPTARDTNVSAHNVSQLMQNRVVQATMPTITQPRLTNVGEFVSRGQQPHTTTFAANDRSTNVGSIMSSRAQPVLATDRSTNAAGFAGNASQRAPMQMNQTRDPRQDKIHPNALNGNKRG